MESALYADCRPENFYSLINPEGNDRFKFFPQCFPIFCLEVERINILVFFRRILSVLNGSIRTLPEPLRMFFYIRMIRRTLKGDVQGDVDTLILCFCNQSLVIVKGAKPSMHSLVSSSSLLIAQGRTQALQAQPSRCYSSPSNT